MFLSLFDMLVCVCVCVSRGVRVYKIGNTLGLYADLTHGNKSITYTHFIFVFSSLRGQRLLGCLCEIVQLIASKLFATYLGEYVLAFI